MEKRKLVGAREAKRERHCAQSPLAWASPERWKKKRRNQASLHVIQYVRKNVSFRNLVPRAFSLASGRCRAVRTKSTKG